MIAQVRTRQDPDTAKPWSLADQPLHAVAALLWALLVVDGTQNLVDPRSNLVDPSCTVTPKDGAGAGAVLGGGAPAAGKAAPAPKTAPIGPSTPSVAVAPTTAPKKDHSNNPFMQQCALPQHASAHHDALPPSTVARPSMQVLTTARGSPPFPTGTSQPRG
jgi:hypothetical protein